MTVRTAMNHWIIGGLGVDPVGPFPSREAARDWASDHGYSSFFIEEEE